MRTLSQTVLCAVLAVVVSMGWNTPQTQAQVSSFNIEFNANPGILAANGSPDSMMTAKWNTGLPLLMDFNSVALRVYNDSTSASNITQFAMTIGDERYNFANFMQTNDLLMPAEQMMVAANTIAANPDIVTLQNVAFVTDKNGNTLGVAPGTDNADRIVVNFGGAGIAPGKSAIFEVRFEYDDTIPVAIRPKDEPLLGVRNSLIAQQYPSFQRILFDVNGTPIFDGNGNQFSGNVDLADLSDNASVTVTFSDELQSAPQFLPDVVLAQTQIITRFHPEPEFRTVPLQGSTIPEPTAIALLLGGLAGISTLRRRLKK